MDQYNELVALLSSVRARWRAVTALHAWTRAAAAQAIVLAAALAVQWAVAPEGAVLVSLWAAAALAAIVCVAWALTSLRRQPGHRQVARFVEERCPELEDTLVTAIAVGEASAVPGPMLASVFGDALRRVRGLDLDRVISRDTLRRTALAAGAASVVLAVLGVFSAGPAGRAARVFTLYAFPEQIVLEVTPGDVKTRAGQPLRIAARIPGSAGVVVPVLRYSEDEGWREARMSGDAGQTFAAVFERVEESFRYSVSAAGVTSREYRVTVIRPPRVEQIDLRYEYPAAFGMQPRLEEDSGDIYGPAGTRVAITVRSDKPIANAALTLAGGARIPLRASGDTLQGQLTIGDDGSYRVALVDIDGLTNPGDTEYFIRTLEDRPPDVRVVRPAGDRQVTPIEEVTIEARADDDFGVAAFDLVYSVRGGQEKAVPFGRDGTGMTINGRRTVYLEDLTVQPGDFVTYYARARDISRGKRSSEARSDIFFLEVKPFEEEFVAAQSQAMSGGSAAERSIEELAEAQKDIIVATWKLDRRRRDSGGQSQEDVRSVARAQAELRKRTQAAAGQLQRGMLDPRRRRLPRPAGPTPPDAVPAGDAMTKAHEAMGSAQQQLEALKTSDALPHEMTALNELLRAQAEVRRRQVQRQQANSMGRGGSNRQQQDLSSLFDRELARQQSTNYETPNSSETREEKDENSALDAIKELARRQDALAREQQELARKQASMSQEELRRQLERLTREQSELRRQAEELARQMQGRRQGSQGGGQGQGQSEQQDTARALREASEEMRSAASDLRRQDAKGASARGSRALDRLRQVEGRMRGSAPDDRRRALGELQLESRQLADAQRQLSSEAQRGRQGGASGEAARRQAAEQERLADRMQRLEQAVKQLASGTQGAEGDERKALADAARELERQRLSERMRNAAQSARAGAGREGQRPQDGQQGGEATPQSRNAAQGGGREGQQIARELERLAERLGAASGQNAESRQLSEQLARTRELRDKLAEVDRQLAERGRSGEGQRPGSSEERAQSENPRGRQGGGGEQAQQGQPQQGQQGKQGQQDGQGRQDGQGEPQPGQRGSSSSRGEASSRGEQGPGDGGRGGEIARPQDGARPWEEAREMLERLRRDDPSMGIDGRQLEGFNPGLSAPGTEGWKQDFTKWEELKQQLTAALEKVETSLASRLREQETKDRLNAGATQAVPEQYRQLVADYYRALASKKKERR